jgi:selenide,water dikinase
MLRLNRHASHLALEAGVLGCTDVTGFSLLGHAEEMARSANVRLVIDANALPTLPGALDYARAGHTTGGANRNRAGLEGKVTFDRPVAAEIEHLLFDPQTSGGLLIAVARDRVDELASALEESRHVAARVGYVEDGQGVVVRA